MTDTEAQAGKEHARTVLALSDVEQAAAYLLLQDVIGLNRERALKLCRDAGWTTEW